MFLLIFIFTFVSAKEYKVFYVKKEFDLGIKKNLNKDYYVGYGSKHGAKKNQYLNVYRKSQIVNNNQKKSKIIQTKIFVAKLKILFVDEDFCIARLHKLADLASNPVPGYRNVMLGDVVELDKKNNTTALNLIKDQLNTKKKENFFGFLVSFINKYL